MQEDKAVKLFAVVLPNAAIGEFGMELELGDTLEALGAMLCALFFKTQTVEANGVQMGHLAPLFLAVRVQEKLF